MFTVMPMNIKLRKVTKSEFGGIPPISWSGRREANKEDGRELGRNQNSAVLGQEVKFEEKWSGL